MSADPDTYAAGSAEAGKRCAICLAHVLEREPVVACPGCRSCFHGVCWEENGGCATYGCEHMPETVKDAADALPASHWGQESKACPACGEDIRITAVLCRHCGAKFDGAAPVSRAEFRAKQQSARTGKAHEQAAWVLFVSGLLPCLAPFALVFGGGWYYLNRHPIEKLPATHRALCVVGLVASVVSSAAIAFVLAFYKAS